MPLEKGEQDCLEHFQLTFTHRIDPYLNLIFNLKIQLNNSIGVSHCFRLAIRENNSELDYHNNQWLCIWALSREGCYQKSIELMRHNEVSVFRVAHPSPYGPSSTDLCRNQNLCHDVDYFPAFVNYNLCRSI